MQLRPGEVKLWAVTEPIQPYNIVRVEDLALKTDITGTNSGINTGDDTKATLISKLGIVTAANDGAAATAGIIVGGLYYTGTIFRVRLV